MSPSWHAKKFFDDSKVEDLIKLGFRPISIERARGMNPQLRSVWEFYAKNIGSVINLANHTAVMGFVGLGWGFRLAGAFHVETGEYEPKTLTKPQFENVLLRVKAVNWSKPQPSPKVLERQSTSAMRELVGDAGRKAVLGLDATLRSLVILAYTAFETLSEDLLETSLDLRPKTLSQLLGRSKPRLIKPWESAGRKKKHPTRDDLRYRSPTDIRHSYWQAFSRDYRSIDSVLNNRSIDTLYAVRNVLVHTGGIVDGLFLQRVLGLPDFARVSKGVL
jgi:hypothetical protein